MQEKASHNLHRRATIAALLLAWAVLAVWQWQEFKVMRDKAHDKLIRQAELAVNWTIGGIKSHRRFGRFVEDQTQVMLDELAKSQDVLAVAMVSDDNRLVISAGKAELLNLSAPIAPGGSWTDAGFRYATSFQIMPDMPGPGMDPSRGMMPRPDRDMSPRAGNGKDETSNRRNGQYRDAPRGPRGPSERRNGRRGPQTTEEKKTENEAKKETTAKSEKEPDKTIPGDEERTRPDERPDFDDMRRDWPPPDDMREPPIGGRFFVVLLMDRTGMDREIVYDAWLRLLVVIAGGVVIFSVVFVWQATVRLAEAHGRARLLETETRHLRDLSQAATGLAHETRNPLGLIRGWTQRWMQAMPDEAGRGQAQAVIEECDRVTARINQFLAFARPCKPQLTAVRPDEIIAELAALVEPDLDAKILKLNAEYSRPTMSIQADREMLRQALFNLIQNAVEFSPEGSAIDVSCRDGEDGAVRIEVADRGPGVPPEAVDLLFTPYHTTRSNGTGLGLAIVNRIAAVHGWQAGYSPRSGGGAVFWIDGIDRK